MTLDGVIQAPGQADEDTTGGFQHGGWHVGYFDDLAQRWVVESVAKAGGFLLGRRTYEIFAALLAKRVREGAGLAGPLNTKPKYVASRTLAEPLAWQNSTVLQDDVGGAVAALKQEDGQDLHVIGSSELVQTLVAHDLVDEFQVMVDPVVVGGGKRLFRDDGALRPLRLLDSQVTTTGVIIATYAPAEA
jgi:dihydrofolate reductase